MLHSSIMTSDSCTSNCTDTATTAAALGYDDKDDVSWCTS